MMLDTNKLIPNRSTKSSLSPVAMTNFIVLKTDLVKIDSILKEKLVLSKVRAGIERQMIQNKRRKEREAELEKKKNKKEEEISINDDPKKTKGGGGLVGFLIGSLIAGVGALVVSALPTFIKIGKLIAKVARPIVRVTGALLNLFGKLVSNTFKAIKNVQEKFPLDKVQQIPKIAATIGAGVVGLVGAMASFSAANAVIGAISARSLKQVIEASNKQLASTTGEAVGSTSLARRTMSNITARPKVVVSQSLMGRPVSTGVPASVRIAQQIAREAQTMEYGTFIVDKIKGLDFTRSQLIVSLLQLVDIDGGDSEIMNILADLAPDEISEAAGGNKEFIKNIFEQKIFQRLRGKVYLDRQGIINLNDEINRLPSLNAGNIGDVQLKEFIRQFANDVYDTDPNKLRVLSGKSKVTGDIFPEAMSEAAARRSVAEITTDMPTPLGRTPISGTGDDAGAIARNILKQKDKVDDAGALARQVLKNKEATKIVTKVLKKPILETFKTTARQTLGAVPLLGDLAILMLDIFVFGEIPARAGFKTIGSMMGAFLGGFLGSLLGPGGTIIGGIIGGIGGDIIGGKIFDFLDVSSRRSEVYRKDEDFGGDTSRDISATDLTRAGLSGFADFATVKDLGGEIGKGMVFKNMENKPEFLLEGDLYEEFKDRGFGAVLSTANSLQGRGFEYLRTQLSYEKKRGRKTRFIPIGLPSQTSNPMVASTVQVIGSPDPSLVLNSLNRQILYKRG